jgi:uncharacterized repeat protein (TIGR01451 family)
MSAGCRCAYEVSSRGSARARRATRLRGSLLGLLALALIALAPATAGAATTSASSFDKIGRDATTGSIGSSVGTAGSTTPGHTIDWVLNYENKTGSTAAVDIKDPITGNQAYVNGSLQIPSYMSPQYSPNGGSSWSSGSPASGADGVGATGSLPSGSVTSAFTTGSATQTTPGGDGYSVEGFGGSVYTVFHHSSGPTVVYCATLAGGVCPDWPAQSTYVNPTPGTPIGTGGPGPYVTAGENGSFIDNGSLYWPVQSQTLSGGTYSVGVQCLNLTTLLSCGYTELDRQTFLLVTYGGAISSDGIRAADGNYYLFDANGNMLCFSPTSGACGSTNITAGQSATGTNVYLGSIMTAGRHVFQTYIGSSGSLFMSCYDTSTSSVCSGFPKNEGVPGYPGFPDFIAASLSPSGSLIGACSVNKATCYSPSGAVVTNPYPNYSAMGYPIATGFGSGLIYGSKFYAGNATTQTIDCFDFSAWSGSGQVPLCSGYSGPANPGNYTVRSLENLPGCLAADGDGAQITIFDAQTGGTCVTATTSVELTPRWFYCDGQSHSTPNWGALTLTGVTGSEYGGGTVTLIGVNGPVPGYTNLALAPGQRTLDLSSLPVSGNTASLTAQINLSAVSDATAVGSAHATLSWDQRATQVCFKSTVGATSCTQSNAISNQATAVTAVAGGVSDAPSGNKSGTATLFPPADPGPCHADVLVKKTGSVRTLPGPGGQVMYTLVVENNGPLTATDVKVSDDLPTGLTLVSAKPSQGFCAKGTVVDCSLGDLAVDGSAQILVTATVNAAASGSIKNCATVTTTKNDTNPSNNSSCVTIPRSPSPPPLTKWDLRVVKKAKPTSVYVGQPVTYTLVVTNNGPDTATGVKVTDTLNKPASVVSVKTTQGKCTKSIPMTCSLGTIKAKKKVTITVVTKPRTSGCKQRNAGSVTGVGTDSNPSNNMSRADICAKPVPLRLTKVADRHTLPAGDLVGYTIRVSNRTVGEARNVKVCDDLPSGLVYVSSKAEAKFTKGQYCWTIKTLAAHKSTSFRITVRAVSSAAGNRVNRASASAPGAKTRRANDAVHVLPARASGGGVTG